MEEDRSTLKVLACKPIGRILFGKPRRRMEDNIRMDPNETGINTRNWVDSA